MNFGQTDKVIIIVPLGGELRTSHVALKFHFDSGVHKPQSHLDIISVYLVDSIWGDLFFTLKYDIEANIFYPTEEIIGVDSIMLDDINTAIQNYIHSL